MHLSIESLHLSFVVLNGHALFPFFFFFYSIFVVCYLSLYFNFFKTLSDILFYPTPYYYNKEFFEDNCKMLTRGFEFRSCGYHDTLRTT